MRQTGRLFSSKGLFLMISFMLQNNLKLIPGLRDLILELRNLIIFLLAFSLQRVILAINSLELFNNSLVFCDE
jgi:hypothetical protein